MVWQDFKLKGERMESYLSGRFLRFPCRVNLLRYSVICSWGTSTKSSATHSLLVMPSYSTLKWTLPLVLLTWCTLLTRGLVEAGCLPVGFLADWDCLFLLPFGCCLTSLQGRLLFATFCLTCLDLALGTLDDAPVDVLDPAWRNKFFKLGWRHRTWVLSLQEEGALLLFLLPASWRRYSPVVCWGPALGTLDDAPVDVLSPDVRGVLLWLGCGLRTWVWPGWFLFIMRRMALPWGPTTGLSLLAFIKELINSKVSQFCSL